MKLEVSLGEAIDKLSILELKIIKITDESKKEEIQKEINVLAECQEYKIKYELYYNMLIYVNEKIWDLTDIIKNITPEHSNFASISNQIFEFNQKRFRIKNWFNLLTNSLIKEQKSYTSTCCNIIVENEELFLNKLPEIHYLAIEYDVITIQSPIISIIQDFLKIPTVIYDEERKKLLNNIKTLNLSTFIIPNDEPKYIFSLKPIVYLIGGMFGDFIQSLSVINENFYETGRKGMLYISEQGDYFRNGLINTYNDTYPVIINQPYIHDFKIYNNELIDINLNTWRTSPNLYKQNWYHIYKQTYNVEWGKRKWLNIHLDDKWKDKVVINTTSYRWAYNIEFKLLKKLYGDNLLFISSDKNQHLFFENITNINVEYYEFSSFFDLVTIINSCKLFAGSLSGPLSIANALHKERICGLANAICPDNPHNLNLDEVFKNLRYNV
jgi:hypothetical protein